MNRVELLKPNVCVMNDIPIEARNTILKIALSQANSSTQDNTKLLEKISNEYNIKKSTVVEIIASYILIIKLFLASNNEEFREIMSGVGFSASFIEELPLLQNKAYFTNTIIQCKRKENRNLVSLKWIIDISLYNFFQ
ncbi:hypothetical protein WA026_004677 [Henosepilachna vigintioctopunctata]|uniref:Uncharacterized protein n=1 Tax=Henosepilachna vigintioctopunctata TaxID=420089 RepID=A0AAW1V9J0_9CUCU